MTEACAANSGDNRNQGVSDSPASKAVLCRVGGTVDDDGRILLSLTQEPGALAAVFGDRGDSEIGKEPPPFTSHAIGQLLNVALGGQKLPAGEIAGPHAWTVNAMLQAAAAFEPTNELEGMIALQAAALHHVTMDCLARGMRTDRNELRQMHLGQANKCARTFAALVETLNRHRGKTTTQKFVFEQVNVAPGAQAVVGSVHQGEGLSRNGDVQPHENTQGSAGSAGDCAPIAALPGPNEAQRQTVSASGGERPEAMPDARRRGGQRSAEGQSQQMGSRPLQRGKRRDETDASADAGSRSRADRLIEPPQ